MDERISAWWCHCTAHGIEPSQAAVARAVAEHLVATGHDAGEYYYGGPGQRTTVLVLLENGTPRHYLQPAA
jgi:hypothetical protein